MRKVVLVASIVGLAAATVSCSKSGNDTPLSPSPTVSSSSNMIVTGAAKGGKGKNAPGPGEPAFTMSLVTDNNANGSPNWNDQVTFDVTTTVIWTHVSVTCSQNGVAVLDANWPATPAVTLSSPAWQGGAADCNADLMAVSGNKNVILGSLMFTAAQ